MSNYMRGQDLLERWDLMDFELFEYLSSGELRPCNEAGYLISHPYYKTESEKSELFNSLKSSKDLLEEYTTPSEERALKIRDMPNAEKGFAAVEHLFTGISAIGMESHYAQELRRALSLPDKDLGWIGCKLPSNLPEAKKILKAIVDSLYYIDDILLLEQEWAKSEKNESEEKYVEYEDLIIKVGEECELIYKVIVQNVGVTDKSLTSRIERRDEALSYLKANGQEFNVIEHGHINDLGIFDFKSNQTKRDFMRRLLKAVIEDITAQKLSGRKLLDVYRMTQ